MKRVTLIVMTMNVTEAGRVFLRKKKKQIYKAKRRMLTANGFATVCIAAILLWSYMPGCDKPKQSQAIIFLGSSVTVPVDKSTDTAAANSQNSQIAAVPEPAILNSAKDALPQWRTVRMRVTAYCPCSLCCGRSADGRTANGHIIKRWDRFVAAPRNYPFGTEFIVPRYNGGKPIKAIDRGGTIKGNCLDVFFQSHKQAAKWGVKYLDVKVRTARKSDSPRIGSVD